MLKKYIVLVLLALAFLSVISLGQDLTLKMEIAQIKLTANKLSKGMTRVEVEELIGKPSFNTGGRYLPTYVFSDGGSLTLDYEDTTGKLFAVYNDNYFNLLSEKYSAKHIDTPIFINNNKVTTAIPSVAINNEVYIQIECLTQYSDIEISWDKEVQQKEFVAAQQSIAQLNETVNKLHKGMVIDEIEKLIGEPNFHLGIVKKTPLYSFDGGETLMLRFDNDGKLSLALNKENCDLLSAEYIARTIEFPIFIKGEKLLTLTPIVAISDNIYVPISDLAEQLEIKVTFNEEKQQLEIVTKKEN